MLRKFLQRVLEQGSASGIPELSIVADELDFRRQAGAHEFQPPGDRHRCAARTLGSVRPRRFHQCLLAARPHRRAASGTHRRPTFSSAFVESAFAGAFVELARQNAAGTACVASVCRAAPPKPGARRADAARVPVPCGCGGVAADQPTSAHTAGGCLCLAAVVGGID